jgi:hypothetical protein
VAADRFGNTAYAAFWILLELYAKEFDHHDGESDFVVRLSWVRLQNVMRMKSKRLHNVLDYFSERGRIVYTRDGDEVTLHIPKFQELADEYTKKRQARRKRKVSGHTPVQEVEVEVEVEREKTSNDDYVYTCEYFRIAPKEHKLYEDAFPDVDLLEQYKLMTAWKASRPGVKHDQIMIFVFNWLQNAQRNVDTLRKTSDILKGGAAAKGLPPEAHKKPPKRRARPTTTRERCLEKIKERKEAQHEEAE